MYRIALCDDEQAEVTKTKGMLSNYKSAHPELDFVIETFENAEQLLLKVSSGYVPDMILMDIYMAGKTGIEAAREIQEMGNKCRIIFLTTSDQHAVEAFRVDAAQYLVKPVSEAELFPVLDKQLEIVSGEKQKYVALQVNNHLAKFSALPFVFLILLTVLCLVKLCQLDYFDRFLRLACRST